LSSSLWSFRYGRRQTGTSVTAMRRADLAKVFGRASGGTSSLPARQGEDGTKARI
jgi:hypothetical protein